MIKYKLGILFLVLEKVCVAKESSPAAVLSSETQAWVHFLWCLEARSVGVGNTEFPFSWMALHTLTGFSLILACYLWGTELKIRSYKCKERKRKFKEFSATI